ncbi:hypothetical protein JCM10908_001505 [Rhodotorula pacifica]|uniref:SWI/SNF chromatin-remodeling complex subunit SNF5 n=1 Tax=Rhodotorula pacifica TaxID=1495444 RepID=UPI00316BE260
MQAPPLASVNGSMSANGALAAPNGFATGSPHIQNQALAGQYTAAPESSGTRRPSIPTYGATTANNLPGPNMPGAMQGMQLTQMQQQALLQRSQQQHLAGAPVAPVPPRRPTGPPPAAVINRNELQDGPEWKVPLRKSTTVIRETEPGEEFPAISDKDQQRLKQWMERDAAYEDEVIAANYDLRVSMQTLFNQAAREQDWLGYPTDPQQRGPPRIQFPSDRRAEQARGVRGQYRKPVPLSKSYARAIAKAPEVLVPIRLELEWEMYKLRDTFTWNLAETAITPQVFASHLCADFRLPREPFEREIVNAVQKQLAEAQLSASYDDYLGDRLTAAREDSRQWLEGRATKRRRVKKLEAQEAESEALMAEEEEAVEKTASEDGDESAAEAADLVLLKDFSNPSDELRLLIKLDITLDAIQLVDQFEWDISDPNNSPEGFAEGFAAELGLSGEFVTAISHSIREQVDFYTRSLCILGYGSGRGIADEDLRRDFLPPVQEPFRTDTADDFTPALNHLVEDEVDRHDREHEREIRRKRRQTKGRGVTLPDREPIRTHRTLLPRPLPGYVTVQYDDRHDKVCPQPELSLPFLLETKPYPPKPANVETVTNSPLKLVPTKEKAANAGGMAATAAANRYRKGLAQSDQPAGEVQAPAPRPPPPKIDPATLGLHEHVIDGQWYCANCGCPASIAVGRRKGPTGKDSLCGECGKYFHRYKRNRPCVYTREAEPHLALVPQQPPPKKRRAPRGKEPSRVGAIASEAAQTSETSRSARTSGRGTPASQALSPVSSTHDGDTDGDESSAPSLKRKRVAQYGSPDRPFVQSDSGNSDLESDDPEGSPPATRQRSTTATTPPPRSSANAFKTVASAPAPPGGPQPEPWMIAAAADLRARHVDERFEFAPRPRPDPSRPQEWRVRCLDCPGKVYNLGPGQTLDGYTVHFKNRIHRINVEMRMSRT